MTRTDVRRGHDWLVDDDATHLQVSGTEQRFALAEDAIIGADGADLALLDPEDLISRRHAQVFREAGHWAIKDLKSKNGLRMDGTQRPKFPLVPGLEIGIGSLVLVVESPRSIALRAYLQRLLGWNATALVAVDRALQSVRFAASHRGPLVLRGNDDLVSIAATIHRHTFASGPLVECNPNRPACEATMRSPKNVPELGAAQEQAAAGTLCLTIEHRPKLFKSFLKQHRAHARIQVIACSRQDLAAGGGAISIPSISSRSAELDRMIDDYGADAVCELHDRVVAAGGIPSFTADDRAWVRTHAADTFGDIEKAALRLVALRSFTGTVAAAARVLELATPTLKQWIGDRRLPSYAVEAR